MAKKKERQKQKQSTQVILLYPFLKAAKRVWQSVGMFSLKLNAGNYVKL